METKRIARRGTPSHWARRRFIKGLAVGGAALLPIRAAGANGRQGHNHVSKGDVAMLRFLAAAETLETDAWQQYTELANNNPPYMAALQAIDGDMPAYLAQQTADSASHAEFINGGSV